jgi:predicted phage terminase large subunit-like protein
MSADVIKLGDKPDLRFLSAREKFNLLPAPKRHELLNKMADEDAARLHYDWEYNGRPKQLAPDYDKSRATSFCMCRYMEAQSKTETKLKLEQFPSCTKETMEVIYSDQEPDEDGWSRISKSGPWMKVITRDEPKVCNFRVDWSVWLLLAGRGFGKTRVGAELVRHMVETGQAKRIHIIAPTAADARDVAIEGESGLLNISPPWNKPLYESTKRRITWPNGATASLFSAEEPERLRGPQCDFSWCLIGETLVNTPNGDKSLYDLQIGDQILTPTGYQTVTNKKLTDPNAQVFTLGTQTAKLTGTFEHKVYSDGEFFQLGDMENRSCVINLNLLNTTGSNLKEEKTVTISGGIFASLMRFGKHITDQCQMVMKSTIVMETSPTTTFQISKCYHQKNMQNVIQKRDLKISKNDGEMESNSLEHVYIARKSLQSRVLTRITKFQSFARSYVTTLGDILNPNLFQRNVKFVQQSSFQNDHIKNTAARNAMLRQVVSEDPNLIKSQVLAVTPSGKSSVYDVTVKGGVFFANGILVHNCDELAAWDPNAQQMVWDMMSFGLRLGKNPRAVVTTTPKPTILIQNLVKQSRDPEAKTIITTGSTYENRNNLAAPFMRQITQYEGTNLGRQEIYAELIDIEESGILKRSWFKKWSANKAMPFFEYVIQSYDTAFTEKTENDPTGCLVLGIFRPDQDSPHCAMILDCWTEHLKYPELRKKATDDYKNTYGDQEAPVDILLIEDKGSGIPLIQDLQRAGLPVRKYNPGRPDKVMRLHAVSHLVYNGRVYIPESKQVPGEFVTWAEDFLREVCSFPNSAHDEYVDCLSQGLSLLRDSGWISIDPVKDKDEEEDEVWGEEHVNPYAV